MNFWDHPAFPAVISALAVLLTTVIVQRVTSRSARRAHDLQKDAEQRKYGQEQIESWRADAKALREERAELKSEMANMRESIRKLEERVSDLTTGRKDDKEYIHELVTWCKVVVVLLRQSGIPYPPVPAGVTDTNPRGVRAQPGT